MARLLIVDPALRDRTGHHYNLNRAVAEAAAAIDLPCAVFGKGVGHEALPGLTVFPVFPADQYRVPVYEPFGDPGARIRRLEEVDAIILDTLRRVLAPVLRAGDTLLIHSPNASTVAAFGRWLAEVLPAADLRAVVVFNQSDHLDPDGGPNAQIEMYRRFFAAVEGLPADRIAVGVDPGYFTPTLQAVAAADWVPFRVPLFLPPMLVRMAAARPERRVGYFGHASRHKGTHLVPGIVRRLVADTGGKAAVTVHADFKFGQETWGDELARVSGEIAALADLPPVRVHSGALDERVFYAELARCGVVMIPYSGFYRKQVSGIFREALAMGRGVAVPEDSTMAAFARAEGFRPATFAEATEAAIAEACRAALDALPDLLPASMDAAAAWRERHSLAAFLSALMADGGGPLAERFGRPQMLE